MSSANALRLQIEHKLADRFPAALTPVHRTVQETAAIGIPEIDRLLEGGLPVGAISEITGPASSGRTCLALSFVAQRTNAGQVCAWIDVGNALDPESVAAGGVNLRRLLWVRCPGVQAKGKQRSRPNPALSATDLLLRAGGFAAIILDMGDVDAEQGRLISSSTWYSFKQSADQARCSLVVLGKSAYAQANAAVVVECSPSKVRTFGRNVLGGSAFDVQLTREKTAPLGTARKPPVSTWMVDTAWEIER
jgi:recombination protein RecA